jgi:hypothetical protein
MAISLEEFCGSIDSSTLFPKKHRWITYASERVLKLEAVLSRRMDGPCRIKGRDDALVIDDSGVEDEFEMVEAAEELWRRLEETRSSVESDC